MENQPVVSIPYRTELNIAWTRVFRLLGALSVLFGLAKLLIALLDPAQMFFMAVYAAADVSVDEFFEANWLRWVQAGAALLVAIGGFWCLLSPARPRLLVCALALMLLIDLFYVVLISMAIWRAARSGEFDGQIGRAHV